MESSPSGYPVEAGFSGAAVWDDELAGVVGMTVAADAHGDLRAAYLIPTDELIRAWPPLADRTVSPCPYRGLYPFRERDVSTGSGRVGKNSWDFDRQEARAIEMWPSSSSTEPSFNRDGQLAAVGVPGGIMLFNVTRLTPIAVYGLNSNTSADGDTDMLRLSPDGNTIASVSNFGAITLIDTRLHRGIPVWVWANRVAVQPDNEHLTAASGGEVAIHSIKNSNSEPVIVRSPANDEVSEVFIEKKIEDLSSDGLRYVFTYADAQKIRLLDVSSASVSEVPIRGNRRYVLLLSFDPSGDFLAWADKSEIIVWSTKKRTEVSRIALPEGYAARELVVSPGGRHVAASSYQGEIRLWDTRSGDHTSSTILRSEDEKSMVFSPDGKWLSIGGQNEIRLWNLNAEKFDSRRILVGGFSMKFSPDGSLLATQTKEHSDEISVWNVRDVALTGAASTSSSLRDFAFTSANRRLAVHDKKGVFVEPFDAPWALRHVCGIVKRNLTRDERNKYLTGFDYVPACLP